MGKIKGAALEFTKSILKDEASREYASKKSLDEILQMAKEQGTDITEDELKAAVAQVEGKTDEMDLDDLDEVAGGTAIVAGTKYATTALFCPNHHKGMARTGNQREDSRFIWWSQHQWEYRCPTCGYTRWNDEEINDPPHNYG